MYIHTFEEDDGFGFVNDMQRKRLQLLWYKFCPMNKFAKDFLENKRRNIDQIYFYSRGMS